MQRHSTLKVFRVMLAGLVVLDLLCLASATLNILGMPMSIHPTGDSFDFMMGSSGGGHAHSLAPSGHKIHGDHEGHEVCEIEDEETGGGKGHIHHPGGGGYCMDVKPSAWTLSNMYRDSPLYMNFRPRTEEAMLIDNICFTFFPLPDDQFTYVMYTSTVYRDGSNLVESDIVTDVQLGIFRAASPYCTYKDHVLGYAGCDTFVMYRCYISNDCRSQNSMYVFGLSQSCKQISISCLQKIEDIIQGNGVPEQDYVALPMKLPTQCVFTPSCEEKEEIIEVYEPLEVVEVEVISPPEVTVIETVPVRTIVEEIPLNSVLSYDSYYPVTYGYSSRIPRLPHYDPYYRYGSYYLK